VITENDGVIITTKPPFEYEMPESLQEKEEKSNETSEEA